MGMMLRRHRKPVEVVEDAAHEVASKVEEATAAVEAEVKKAAKPAKKTDKPE